MLDHRENGYALTFNRKDNQKMLPFEVENSINFEIYEQIYSFYSPFASIFDCMNEKKIKT